ncbi:MAG: ankyrin repeat domain-containing protein [Gammaproteobacteria bacterium]
MKWKPSTARRDVNRHRAAGLIFAAVFFGPAVASADLDDVRAALRRKDYELAQQLLEPVARQGDAEAQYQLGVLIRNGQGSAPDPVVALHWLTRAAEAGNAAAQYLVGVMYQSGSGTLADQDQARRWLERAARGGHDLARARLAAQAEAETRRPTQSDQAEQVPGGALADAAAAGRLAEVRTLIGRGASPDDRDGSGRSALFAAAAAGHDSVVRALLDARARADASGALIASVRGGYLRTVAALLDAGIDPDARDAHGNTALILAAGAGHTSIARLLIEHRAGIGAQNDSGCDAVCTARANRRGDMLKLLAARGARSIADPGTPDPATSGIRAAAAIEAATAQAGRFHGWPPLNAAAALGRADAVQALLARGAAVDSRDPEGRTPLARAAQGGSDDVLAKLLAAGAAADAEDESGRTPLMLAATAGHAGLVARLIGAGAAAQRRMNSGESALELAAASGHAEVVSRLIEAGAPPDGRSVESSPVWIALKRRDARLLQVLLNAGANPLAADGDGRTALHLAAGTGWEEGARALIALEADVDRIDREGYTALMRAAATSTPIVAMLLDRHAALHTATASGNTPLMIAAGSGNASAVGLLLKAGSRIDQRNRDGNTALMLAAAAGQADAARVLLDAGADTRFINDRRQDARTLAATAGHDELVALIDARRAQGRFFGIF